MNHIDEHSLELYVLNAPEVESRRAEIRRHLGECAGCRGLVDEITDFHAELAEEMDKREVTPIDERALARRHGGLSSHAGQFGTPMKYAPSTPVQRIRYFIRRHPVATTAGTLGAALSLALLGLLFLPRTNGVKEITDKNPSYIRLNESTGMFEVNNKENETLWREPLTDIKAAVMDEEVNKYRTYQLADLNGDGVNEVITTLPFEGNSAARKGNLRIYNAADSLINSVQPDKLPVFNGVRYEAPFEYYGILTDTTAAGKIELYSLAGNGRSPVCITRLNAQGVVIGEYWHYGNFGTIYLARLAEADGREKKVLIACGINDVDEKKGLPKPVIVVLDPSRITDKKEAGTTRGFGLPPSDAEIFSIQLPLSDFNLTEKVNANTTRMWPGVNAIRFFCQTDLNGVHCDFEYVFDMRMRPIEVKSTTWTTREHSKLKSQHIVHGDIDESYLKNLLSRIRYWNGSEWKSDFSTVSKTGI